MSGPSLSVVVSPLDLPGIDLACYDLLVANGAGQPVIARGDPGTRLDGGDDETLCSTRFGDGAGGSISYVAPCDSSEPSHVVTLWVDGLYSGTMAAPVLLDYEDPCPGGCVLSAACAENADTPVTFNLTIMRPASQGFFDVAVSFDSVFCSAKLDCEAEGGGPLKLLHDPTSGERSSTVVVGLACTAGPGGEGTVLLRDPIRVSCGGVDWDLDPALAEGNAYSTANPAPAGSPVWQYAVYAGREDLPCGAESCEKVYWNVAIAMELTTPSCTLTTTATAGSPTSLPGDSTPEATRWPLITWEVDLTSEGGTRMCSRHPLNGEPEGVGTDYTSLEELRIFDFRFDGTPFGEGISGQSCFTILQQHPEATDGVYLIDPDGPGGVEPFEVYCDMSTDGGGWTLVSQARPDTDAALNLCTSSAIASLDLDDTTVSGPAKLADGTINLIWSTHTARELLMKSDPSWSATTATWTRVCALDFVEGYAWNTTMPSVSVVSDLDTLSIGCSVGTLGTGQVTGVFTPAPGSPETGFCGYSFLSSSGSFFIYGAGVNYVYPNVCGSDVLAGRSWLGGSSYGCQLSKVFVR